MRDRHRHPRVSVRAIPVMLCVALTLSAPSARSADDGAAKPPGWRIQRSPPPEGATTHTVVAGERFRAGWLKRWIFGSDYRRLWTTPVEVAVLDLDSVGGGLTALRTGGYGQSISLHFAGANGRGYTVRSLDKDPTRRIWDDLKNTVVDDVLQDQVKALLPSGVLVCDRLMDATGILHSPSTLVVIPDDPRLGEFRGRFAGLVGTLQEDPSEGPESAPGFAGSRQVSGSEAVWRRLEKDPRDRVDARAYLEARLMDFLLNDKDRHAGQWRWARFPEGDGYRWVPIPEDRDQAFIDIDGFGLAVARLALPSQIEFDEEYPNLVGLTMTGWEMDREVLVGLDGSAWDSTAAELQRELPDSVIDDAARRLPRAYHELVGDRLAASLKSRRDRLPEFARRYYRLITRQAEITATDANEVATFEHEANGDLTVRLALRSNSDVDPGPYFERTFRASETDEVRLYLRGGDDAAEVRGAEAEITVRIDGGGGDDAFVNSSRAGAGKTRFYDARGENRFEEGMGASVDRRPFQRPPGPGMSNMKHALDWGKRVITFPVVTVSPDLGAYVGVVSDRQVYGWRKVPFASSHRIQLGVGTNGPVPFLAYTGAFREVFPRWDARLDVEYSGLRVIRYDGLGNATKIPRERSYYEVDQNAFAFAPALSFEAGANRAGRPGSGSGSLRPTFSVALGPVVKYSDTPAGDNAGRFITSGPALPYGAGSFGQVGARADGSYDTRDNPTHPRRGVLFEAGGALYPKIWDVAEAFGRVNGAASVYLTARMPTSPTLALRAGGKKVWGDYPFHEAAYVGGPGTLRGYRESRYGGDASAYGNAELRFGLFDLRVLVPARFGLFAATDAGRAFLDGDPAGADDWHTGVGGGFWLSFIDRLETLSVAIMKGDDLTGVYLRTGFMF